MSLAGEPLPEVHTQINSNHMPSDTSVTCHQTALAHNTTFQRDDLCLVDVCRQNSSFCLPSARTTSFSFSTASAKRATSLSKAGMSSTSMAVLSGPSDGGVGVKAPFPWPLVNTHEWSGNPSEAQNKSMVFIIYQVKVPNNFSSKFLKEQFDILGNTFFWVVAKSYMRRLMLWFYVLDCM